MCPIGLRWCLWVGSFVFVLAALCGVAQAQNVKTGDTVYRQVCTNCHNTGVSGAPRFGESSDWRPLIDRGQVALTIMAWRGVRAMPPQGGRPALKLEEFARAVAYMVREAGGDWDDPDAGLLAKLLAAATRDGSLPVAQ